MNGEDKYINTGLISFKGNDNFVSLYYKKGIAPFKNVFEYKDFKLSRSLLEKHITDNKWHYIKYDGKQLHIDDKIIKVVK